MREMVCIVCPNGCLLQITQSEGNLLVTGNLCPKGKTFAINEMTCPVRGIASTVRTDCREVPRLPVRTDGEIPLKDVFPVMHEINRTLASGPIQVGEIIIQNVCNTGVNIIATAELR